MCPELLDAAEDDVNALSKIHKSYWEESRYKILIDFCSHSKNILSVGCGPKEPLIIGALNAIDCTPLSEKYLRESGWKGCFTLGTCVNLPYPNKFFDVVVCSEVIEHLPTLDDVTKTFIEVNRVSKKWIITTPNSDVIKPKSQNKHHLQFFTLTKIKEIMPKEILPLCRIYTHDYHIYIEKNVK